MPTWRTLGAELSRCLVSCTRSAFEFGIWLHRQLHAREVVCNALERAEYHAYCPLTGLQESLRAQARHAFAAAPPPQACP